MAESELAGKVFWKRRIPPPQRAGAAPNGRIVPAAAARGRRPRVARVGPTRSRTVWRV